MPPIPVATAHQDPSQEGQSMTEKTPRERIVTAIIEWTLLIVHLSAFRFGVLLFLLWFFDAYPCCPLLGRRQGALGHDRQALTIRLSPLTLAHDLPDEPRPRLPL